MLSFIAKLLYTVKITVDDVSLHVLNAVVRVTYPQRQVRVRR